MEEKILVNNEVYLTVPEGFHVMSEEDVRRRGSGPLGTLG